MGADDTLRLALADAKATFTRLSPKPSLEPQRPLLIRTRVEAVEPSPEIDLPPPTEGHQLYSLNQAMNIMDNLVNAGNSVSVGAVVKEMIQRKLILVKRAQMFRLVKKYIGEGKPEAPVYWGNVGGTEIMTIGDLKKQFLTHQGQRIGREWLRNDTTKAVGSAARKASRPCSPGTGATLSADLRFFLFLTSRDNARRDPPAVVLETLPLQQRINSLLDAVD